MSVSVTSRPEARRRRLGYVAVLLLDLVLGVPAYFVSFLVAYGFESEIRLANHVTFLVLVAAFAAVTGVVGTAMTWSASSPMATRVGSGTCVSLALNAAVVGAGSIVSAAHKNEGSVSAAFSASTDGLVAAALFALALAFGAAALGLDRRARRREV